MYWSRFSNALPFGSKVNGSPQNRPREPLPDSWAAPTITTPKRSQEINNNFWWRWRTQKWVKPYKDEEIESGVAQVSAKYCVKLGTEVQLAEAITLQYLKKNTSVPVPKVYCAFKGKKDNTTYIVMECIDGEPIGQNWAEKSEAEKESLMVQLKDIFQQLRTIPHPQPGALAAVDMQALFDPRCWKGYLKFGPFANESDFNNFLHCGIQADDILLDKEKCPWITDEERAEIRRVLEMHQSREHKICFTHGDASSSNVLVKDGKIVALIDFELSGWYPEYWVGFSFH